MEANKPTLNSLYEIKLDEIQRNEVLYITLFEQLDSKGKKQLTFADCNEFLDNQLKKF